MEERNLAYWIGWVAGKIMMKVIEGTPYVLGTFIALYFLGDLK